jgi:3'-5' exoribonuclease
VNSVENHYLKALLEMFFVQDEDFIKRFKFSSAAKSVHHGFVGGLLQHTLGVAKLCDYYSRQYKYINRDLLMTAALCHDIGKIKEISPFPENDYTDSGNFIGHIVMGVEMIDEKIKDIDGFPPLLADELRHCILAHHGEYEFGSPKKPAIIEAVALNFADNTDAKFEIFTEMLDKSTSQEWLGFNRLFDSNVRATKVED